MKEEIRKERVNKYGSFLYCPAKGCLCFGRETDQKCKYPTCLLDDPEHLALQQRIKENQKKLGLAENYKGFDIYENSARG